MNEFPQTETIKVIFNPATISEGCRIDPTKLILQPPILLEIGSKPVMTEGNFSTVIGKAKAKKTYFLISLISAACSDKSILGRIQGRVPANKVNLWFDTEMSEYHISRMVKRCCEMIGNPDPHNLEVYGLRGLNPSERAQIIEHKIYNTPNVAIVFIDGLRDLLTKGINDEEEATMLTSKFLKWTSEKKIHLVLVLHQNKNDFNARGHIGTEVTNKSESVISLTKSPDDENISIVEPEFSRDIDFESFTFKIDEEGLPIECDAPIGKQAKKIIHPDLIDEQMFFSVLGIIFKKNQEPKYRELWQGMKFEFAKRDFRFGDNKAKEFLDYSLNNNWISKNGIGYKYNRAIF